MHLGLVLLSCCRSFLEFYFHNLRLWLILFQLCKTVLSKKKIELILPSVFAMHERKWLNRNYGSFLCLLHFFTPEEHSCIPQNNRIQNELWISLLNQTLTFPTSCRRDAVYSCARCPLVKVASLTLLPQWVTCLI